MASTSAELWLLDEDVRESVARRTSSNLLSLAFYTNRDLTERLAVKTAARFEREAYAAAQAQSTTTTGKRPLAETNKFYTRKLAELVIAFAKGEDADAIEDIEASKGVFDLSGGTRDFLSKESAEKIFEHFLFASSTIHTVILSTKSFGIEAANVAARALRKIHSTLTTANLSDIIGGRPELEALQVLHKLSRALASSKLKSLDLSNNALGEKGLRACQDLFASQSQLESLSLRNIGCSPNACLALSAQVADMQLKRLFLYNNMSGDEGGKYISKMLLRMPSIEAFQMASSRVGPSGVLALAEGLSVSTGLTSLDLNDNPATAESVPGIVKLLQIQSKLKRLNLSDTSLGDDGIQELSKTLHGHVPDLEVLELALNEMTFEGAKELSRALMQKTALRVLDLHENELEDRGVLLIAKAVAAIRPLERVDLSANEIHRAGAVAVVKALRGKPSFEKLDIDANEISPEGIAEMKALLDNYFGNLDALGSLAENDPDVDEKETLLGIDVDQSNLDDLIQTIRLLSLKT